jgi:ankyrin repeat protein
MILSESKPPTKTLIRHIKRRDWDGARLRALVYPWDAHYHTRSDKVTPMHLLCLYRAPLDLVELLLDANPDALVAHDSQGWTPIHLVILYGGNEEVALMLIRRGGAPAASLQSPDVGSPLHLACRHGASIAVMEEILQADLSMATTANENGTKPAEVVWNQFVRNPENEVLIRVLHQGNKNALEDIECDQSAMDVLLKRLQLLLQAAKQEESTDDSMMMHNLLSHHSALGDLTQFLEIAVRLFPEQVEAMDDKGNFLLHIAASSPPVPPTKYMRKPFALPKDSIDILFRAYPAAASFTNHAGDLPLHLALQQGRRTWTTGISSLVEADSDALQLRDQNTQLYPFLLAAAFPSGHDTKSLGTIFELLLACPHVVSC